MTREPRRAWRWCQRCETHFDTKLNHHHQDDMTKQTYIPGTEPPARVEAVDIALERWYEAKQTQRDDAAVTAVRMDSVIEAAIEAGIEKYRFTDPDGKQRILDVSAQRRARVRKAPSAKQEAADREFDQGAAAATVIIESGPPIDAESAAARLLKPGQKRGRKEKAA